MNRLEEISEDYRVETEADLAECHQRGERERQELNARILAEFEELGLHPQLEGQVAILPFNGRPVRFFCLKRKNHLSVCLILGKCPECSDTILYSCENEITKSGLGYILNNPEPAWHECEYLSRKSRGIDTPKTKTHSEILVEAIDQYITPLPGLTPKQARLFPVLLMIDKFIAKKYYIPSYRDISAAFPNSETGRAASTNSAFRWILNLIEFGWIEMESGVCRSTTITPAGMKLLAKYKESSHANNL